MNEYNGPEDTPSPAEDEEEFFFVILGMATSLVEMIGVRMAVQFLMMAWMKQVTKRKMRQQSPLKFRILEKHKQNL